VRLAGTLYGLYDKSAYIDRIFTMLDELESHQRDRVSRPNLPPMPG